MFKGTWTHAIGRRKEAVARVFLKPGKGDITVNKTKFEDYFGLETLKMIVVRPLKEADALDKFDVKVTVAGGGKSGQAGAIRLGISRALIMINPENRPPLKKLGLLTRDPREVERKKYGRHKARKRPQFSKR
jgi:small subunit ribosomal protein S9